MINGHCFSWTSGLINIWSDGNRVAWTLVRCTSGQLDIEMDGNWVRWTLVLDGHWVLNGYWVLGGHGMESNGKEWQAGGCKVLNKC